MQAVYEDDLVHRCAGDASTLLPMEAPFPVARSWVEQEAEQQVITHHASAQSAQRCMCVQIEHLHLVCPLAKGH